MHVNETVGAEIHTGGKEVREGREKRPQVSVGIAWLLLPFIWHGEEEEDSVTDLQQSSYSEIQRGTTRKMQVRQVQRKNSWFMM